MKKLSKLIAGASVFALAVVGLTACGGSGDSGSGDAASGGDPNAIISVSGCEPERPLVPGDTGETCAGDPIDVMYSGLVRLSAAGEAVNEVAESIETTDSKVFTVKLKEDWTFTDGSPVDADSFINAWNYTANAANAQRGSAFFDIVEGYDALNPAQDEGESDADYAKRVEALAGETLKGLVKDGDYAFTITLTAPSAMFLLRLGYTSYYPLPKTAFGADGKVTKEYGEHPETNGPYKLDVWEHDTKISIRKDDNYKGTFVPKNGGLDFIAYAGNNMDAALSDVQAGNLDVLGSAGGQRYKAFKDSTDIQWHVETAPQTDPIEIPYYLEHFGQDEEGALRRKAISQAIDRQSIRDNIGDGSGTDSVAFCPKIAAISGCDQEIAGHEVLSFNEPAAKEAWAAADAINQWNDPVLDLWYNADSGGKETYDAIVNSYVNILGIKGEAKTTPTFNELLDLRYDFKVEGAYRAGWQPDYPSVENFLQPMFATGGSANTGKYSNKDFDDLISLGSGQATLEEANVYFTQAQELAMKDLPAIFIGDGTRKGAYSLVIKGDTIANTWKGVPNFLNLEK
ncbi:MAG: ABC transporter substrate-binding protein [Bifidobacteriaceae bacterium]|jgi:oligopeptide transport system substrate-binding protein|nr:ABC transporter substrate-binding protein [Bifidobacteriaceae bacterium]